MKFPSSALEEKTLTKKNRSILNQDRPHNSAHKEICDLIVRNIECSFKKDTQMKKEFTSLI